MLDCCVSKVNLFKIRGSIDVMSWDIPFWRYSRGKDFSWKRDARLLCFISSQLESYSVATHAQGVGAFVGADVWGLGLGPPPFPAFPLFALFSLSALPWPPAARYRLAPPQPHSSPVPDKSHRPEPFEQYPEWVGEIVGLFVGGEVDPTAQLRGGLFSARYSWLSALFTDWPGLELASDLHALCP